MDVQSQLYSENLCVPMWDDDVNLNLQQQQLYSENLGFPPLGFYITSNYGASCSSSGEIISMPFSHSLAAELDKQRQELDWVLQFQNERLRIALQEETRQQIAILSESYESKMMGLMWKKEEHLAIATKKTMELQECLRRREMEIQVWKRMVIESESLITNLKKELEKASNKAEEEEEEEEEEEDAAESFRDSSTSIGGNRVVGENRGDNDLEVEEELKIKKMMVCKLCNSRSSCVVFLPCRHVCSCKYCEASLGFCPVCESLKKGSLVVYLV